VIWRVFTVYEDIKGGKMQKESAKNEHTRQKLNLANKPSGHCRHTAIEISKIKILIL
jgi:hypothetical protein